MKIILNYIFILLCLNLWSQDGQTIQKRQDSLLLTQQCIIENAKYFLDTPYRAHTLEVEGQEKLTYFSYKFDCVTFIEYVVALSIFQTNESKVLKTFDQILQDIRYRNGMIDGYESRLHYFSEWIKQQQNNGILKDITKDIGGIPYQKSIDFISKNHNKYPKIKNKKQLNKIIQSEKTINSFTYHYIPKKEVNNLSSQLKDGDIIAITTNIAGLDVVHTGFVIKSNRQAHLLHASEKFGKVVISGETIGEYLAGNKHQSGIIVLRCL